MTTKTQSKTKKTKTKKSDRTVLSVHTKKTTSARLDRLAKSTHSTKSALANEALESFLDHQEWVVSEIKKGVADIDAGRIIEHAEMIEWAKNLKKSSKNIRR